MVQGHSLMSGLQLPNPPAFTTQYTMMSPGSIAWPQAVVRQCTARQGPVRLSGPQPALRCAELHELLPSILPQLGADNMDQLRKLAQNFPGAGAMGRGGPPGGVGTIEEEDEGDGAPPSLTHHSVHCTIACGGQAPLRKKMRATMRPHRDAFPTGVQILNTASCTRIPLCSQDNCTASQAQLFPRPGQTYCRGGTPSKSCLRWCGLSCLQLTGLQSFVTPKALPFLGLFTDTLGPQQGFQ